MSAEKPILGMIAGNGILPIIAARGARSAGYRVCCVGLRDQFLPDLPSECDEFSVAGMARIGRWIRLLKKWGAEDTVMVGGVEGSYDYVVYGERKDIDKLEIEPDGN